MKIVPVEGSTLTIGELVDLARDQAVILTRDGEPVATVNDLSGTDWESASLAKNSRLAAILEHSRRLHQDEGGIGLDQLRQELGLEAAPEGLASQG